ncbi:hypothetical protein PtA15_8A324 [Puccinia triticina]|uniref:Uncharacterized protein n=1 Tax=Puccinia triticina TaxID=208348 RepID=A0ABY7CRV3_9BASI|nr:uncharacterized protein PtA15_8A324 [Puccinia triticina]WAQ87420.1 hypothetical protein PtA15_8A324 [Puccinia triticina]WAR57273.1 hypothetical protein PtB15_8B320 [Puccinia triticina]
MHQSSGSITDAARQARKQRDPHWLRLGEMFKKGRKSKSIDTASTGSVTARVRVPIPSMNQRLEETRDDAIDASQSQPANELNGPSPGTPPPHPSPSRLPASPSGANPDLLEIPDELYPESINVENPSDHQDLHGPTQTPPQPRESLGGPGQPHEGDYFGGFSPGPSGGTHASALAELYNGAFDYEGALKYAMEMSVLEGFSRSGGHPVDESNPVRIPSLNEQLEETRAEHHANYVSQSHPENELNGPAPGMPSPHPPPPRGPASPSGPHPDLFDIPEELYPELVTSGEAAGHQDFHGGTQTPPHIPPESCRGIEDLNGIGLARSPACVLRESIEGPGQPYQEYRGSHLSVPAALYNGGLGEEEALLRAKKISQLERSSHHGGYPIEDSNPSSNFLEAIRSGIYRLFGSSDEHYQMSDYEYARELARREGINQYEFQRGITQCRPSQVARQENSNWLPWGIAIYFILAFYFKGLFSSCNCD